MNKFNRKCIVCGREYSYCPDCSKDKDKPTWMNSYDTENCHTIFETLVSYNFKHITATQAKEIFDGCDLKIPLHQGHKKEIDAIYAEAKKDENPVEENPIAETKFAPKTANKWRM